MDSNGELHVSRRALQVIGWIGATLSAAVMAQPQANDPRQLALLPPYCMYTEGYPGHHQKDKREHWISVLGGGFTHLHHYCWALSSANQANFSATSQRERAFLLNYAVGQFDYVIRNAGLDFVLAPEILTEKGQALLRLDRGPLAVVEFERAIQIKPDYWPPYAHLSDYYNAEGDKESAVAWLEKGLAAQPEAQALQRRMARLRSQR